MINKMDIENFAVQIRILCLQSFKAFGKGHVGGAMSMVELLAVLYGSVMNYDPKRPGWKERDWLVCSKGHAGPALYATLALKGYFEEKLMMSLNQGGTILPSHCDMNLTHGIDMTTGSLGQGLSTAIGITLGNRLEGIESWTFVILGDGELNEGQIWEGVIFSNHYKLDRLIVFIDRNKQQLDGYTKDIMDMPNLYENFTSFGWHSQTIDGHDVRAVAEAIDAAKNEKGRPSVIILNTIKGKGCAFAEGIVSNHHMEVSDELIDDAIDKLNKKIVV